MMKAIWDLKNQIFFISSYIPVFLMIFIGNLNGFSFKNLVYLYKENPIFWIILGSISFISFILFLVILISVRHLSIGKAGSKYSYHIHIKNYSLVDLNALNYFVTCMIPIISLNPGNWPSIVMNLLLMIIELIYFQKSHSFQLNILWLLFGYRIYKVTTYEGNNMLLITKSEIDDFNLNGDDIEVYQINHGKYLVQKLSK